MGYDIKALRSAGIQADNVRTYSKFHEICDVFINGHEGYFYPFLIIIGRPGLGKSTKFERQKNVVYHKGKMTPKGFFEFCKGHANMTLCFDDVKTILRHHEIVSMLTELMNDRPVKTLTYSTNNGVDTFKTRSRVCIILNEIPKSLGLDNAAVFERSKFVIFQPTVEDVHAEAIRFRRKDSEIYDHIGRNLHLITTPTLRWYTNSLREKRAGQDWRTWLAEQWEINDDFPNLPFVAEIVGEFTDPKEQLAAWTKKTGMSKAEWHRDLKTYREIQDGFTGDGRALKGKKVLVKPAVIENLPTDSLPFPSIQPLSAALHIASEFKVEAQACKNECTI